MNLVKRSAPEAVEKLWPGGPLPDGVVHTEIPGLYSATYTSPNVDDAIVSYYPEDPANLSGPWRSIYTFRPWPRRRQS